MKAWAWMVIVPMLGTLAHAESLGDAARRERERRAKAKGDAAEAAVIRDEELAARPARASKGTFSPAAGSAGAQTKPDAARASTSPAPRSDAPPTEVEGRRVTARARLESTYDRIRDMATQFWEDIVRYRSCSSADIPQSKTCIALLSDIERLAIAIGTSMEDAEDAARQGWLTPGEVRDARSTHGMDHSFWDELVRFVHQYRR